MRLTVHPPSPYQGRGELWSHLALKGCSILGCPMRWPPEVTWCLADNGRSRMVEPPHPNARGKINTQRSRFPSSYGVLSRGLGLCFLCINGKRLSPPEVPEKTNVVFLTNLQPSGGPRRLRGTCRVKLTFYLISTVLLAVPETPERMLTLHSKLVEKPPLGTHIFYLFAARGTGGWQNPSALGRKATSPATLSHKWTAWKKKSKCISL